MNSRKGDQMLRNAKIYILIAFTGIFIALSSGCNTSGAPRLPFSIIDIAEDGAGNVIIAYSKQNEINLQKVDSSGKLLWPGDGITAFKYSNEESAIVSLAVGNADNIFLLASFSPREAVDGGHPSSLYIQKVDFEGNVLWGNNGLLVSTTSDYQDYPQLVYSGTDGAIVAWDKRVPETDTFELYAQKIGSTGEAEWTQVISQGIYQTVEGDSFGGIIVACTERPTQTGNKVNLHVKRINVEGKVLWNLLVSNEASYERYPLLSVTKAGISIITWKRQFVDDSGYLATEYRLQQIDENGNPISDETVIEGVESEAVIVAGHHGRVVLLGVDEVPTKPYSQPELPLGESPGTRVPPPYPPEVMPERVLFATGLDSNSDSRWRVPIFSVDNAHHLSVTATNAAASNNTLVSWRLYERNPNIGGIIYAQKLDDSGKLLWAEDGIKVFHTNLKYQGKPYIAGDGSGGAIIVAMVGHKEHAPDSIRAQRIDSQGNISWGQEGLTLNP
jgi:hypothetical protein